MKSPTNRPYLKRNPALSSYFFRQDIQSQLSRPHARNYSGPRLIGYLWTLQWRLEPRII